MNLADKYIGLFFKDGVFSDLLGLQMEKANTEFTRTEKLIIYVLDKQGMKNMGQLASIFRIPHSTTNFLVKRLVKSGVVATRKSEEDRRVIEVYLTEKGKEKSGEILVNIEQRLRKLMECFTVFLTDKMEPAELEVVKKAIRVLTE